MSNSEWNGSITQFQIPKEAALSYKREHAHNTHKISLFLFMWPFLGPKGKTMPGLTSVASFVNHEHIGTDANYPTDITF